MFIGKIEKSEKEQKFQWVVAKAIVEDGDKILMCRRREDVDFGMYELPGGKMEVGENIIDGLRREIIEETGLKIEVEEIKNLNEIKEIQPFMIISDPLKRVALFFKAKKTGGNLLIETEEQTEIRFYNKSEVRSMLAKNMVRPLVKLAVQKWLSY